MAKWRSSRLARLYPGRPPKRLLRFDRDKLLALKAAAIIIAIIVFILIFHA